MTTFGKVDGRGWALLATSLGFAVVQLDVSVVNVAIQPIGADLGGSLAGLQWVVNAYTVAFAALILSAGAPYPVLAGSLAVAGFALGVLVPAITAALLGSVEPSRSGVASGTLNTARQTGSVLGVSLFGALASGGLVAGLRLGAAISVGLALTCAALALGVTPEPA